MYRTSGSCSGGGYLHYGVAGVEDRLARLKGDEVDGVVDKHAQDFPLGLAAKAGEAHQGLDLGVRRVAAGLGERALHRSLHA